MILAAGLGTRLKPVTDTVPKALVNINNYTLLELQIRKLKSAGIHQIIINIHHHAKMIKDYLDKNSNFGCDIELSDESEKLLETGGGLKKAEWYFADSEPFIVHNVDVLTNINIGDMFNFHQNSGALVALAVMERKSSRYFIFDEDDTLVGWKNEKIGETKFVRKPLGRIKLLAFSGVQVIHPKIFEYFPPKDFFSLIDLYLSAAISEKIIPFEHSEGTFWDLGKMENLLKVEKIFEDIRNTYQV